MADEQDPIPLAPHPDLMGLGFLVAALSLHGRSWRFHTSLTGSSSISAPSRRHLLIQTAAAATTTASGCVYAADEPRLWISGKSDPIRKTSKDKVDGTKKDPKYLSCLNDCVPRCLGPPASGVQKDRLDCLSECQDECCFTYQQCTATIR
jgi:hypothetical protein